VGKTRTRSWSHGRRHWQQGPLRRGVYIFNFAFPPFAGCPALPVPPRGAVHNRPSTFAPGLSRTTHRGAMENQADLTLVELAGGWPGFPDHHPRLGADPDHPWVAELDPAVGLIVASSKVSGKHHHKTLLNHRSTFQRDGFFFQRWLAVVLPSSEPRTILSYFEQPRRESTADGPAWPILGAEPSVLDGTWTGFFSPRA